MAKQKKKAKAGVKAAPKKKPAKTPVKAKARPRAARAKKVPAGIIAVGTHALDENTTGNESGPWGYGVLKQTYPAPGMHDSLRRVQFGQGGGR